MKPNIFNIATKELHQDAFITWLLQWADPQNKQYDTLLQSCGEEFVRRLISTQIQHSISSITEVKAERQWEYIDVWAEVYTPERNYFIIIEDKIFTSEHSNQLISYKKIGEDYCKEKGFTLVCIYIKTGSEPEKVLNSIRSKGYSTFNRNEFIQLLNGYDNINNNIFRDFTDRLLNIQATYSAFETTPIDSWNNECWIGFYEFLESEIGLVSWEYVNPPGGAGFWGACLNWEDWKGFPVYLQIEQGKLCFKISTHPEDIDVDYEFEKGTVRNSWNDVILTKARELEFNEIQRPNRFGYGNYMTAAVIDKSFWLGNDGSIINKSQVVSTLTKYKDFLNSCLR